MTSLNEALLPVDELLPDDASVEDEDELPSINCSIADAKPLEDDADEPLPEGGGPGGGPGGWPPCGPPGPPSPLGLLPNVLLKRFCSSVP
jgi:hypothetical protein